MKTMFVLVFIGIIGAMVISALVIDTGASRSSYIVPRR